MGLLPQTSDCVRSVEQSEMITASYPVQTVGSEELLESIAKRVLSDTCILETKKSRSLGQGVFFFFLIS